MFKVSPFFCAAILPLYLTIAFLCNFNKYRWGASALFWNPTNFFAVQKVWIINRRGRFGLSGLGYWFFWCGRKEIWASIAVCKLLPSEVLLSSPRSRFIFNERTKPQNMLTPELSGAKMISAYINIAGNKAAKCACKIKLISLSL